MTRRVKIFKVPKLELEPRPDPALARLQSTRDESKREELTHDESTRDELLRRMGEAMKSLTLKDWMKIARVMKRPLANGEGDQR